MAESLDDLLGAFDSTDYTVRMCNAVFKVVPFAPALPFYGSLEACIRDIDPKVHPKVIEHAHELARGDGPQRALWMFNALDTADSGITVYTGIKSAVALYKSEKGERLDAIETDPQQAADAVLKGLALAFVIYKLFDGGPTDKVGAFRELTAGQALAFYFASVEVGLPFADNALLSGGSFVSTLYDKLGDDQASKLASIAGEEASEGARGVFAQLLGPVEGLVKTSAEYLTPIADAAVEYAPKAVQVGDKVAGVVATAADVMPVYRYLGARLVAEYCARKAIADVGAKVEQAEKENPALVPVKYTKAAPEPEKKGCFLWPFVALLAATGLGPGDFGA